MFRRWTTGIAILGFCLPATFICYSEEDGVLCRRRGACRRVFCREFRCVTSYAISMVGIRWISQGKLSQNPKSLLKLECWSVFKVFRSQFCNILSEAIKSVSFIVRFKVAMAMKITLILLGPIKFILIQDGEFIFSESSKNKNRRFTSWVCYELKAVWSSAVEIQTEESNFHSWLALERCINTDTWRIFSWELITNCKLWYGLK